MSDSARAPTTLSNIGVVMFAVSDNDAALAFYTEKLGFEVRGAVMLRQRVRLGDSRLAPIGRILIVLLGLAQSPVPTSPWQPRRRCSPSPTRSAPVPMGTHAPTSPRSLRRSFFR